jgi:hypothetical protein
VDTSGLSVNTIGIILMVRVAVVGVVWSGFSPWSRRRTVAVGDRVVEERRIEREF